MAQMNLSTEKKITDVDNRLVVAKGEGEGVGWTRSLGLIDTNYYIYLFVCLFRAAPGAYGDSQAKG